MSIDRPGPVRVFLLDRSEVVRAGIVASLHAVSGMIVVGEAAEARGARRVMTRAHADIAVIDLELADGSGIDVCRELADPPTGIAPLIFTGFDDDGARIDAAEAGAVAYILKHVPTDELVMAIRHVAEGRRLLDRAEVRMASRHLRDTEEGRVRQLTPQELRIFVFVGQGLTNVEIGDRLDLTEKTVKNYMSHVLAKLQLAHRTEVAALWARLDERRRRDGREPLRAPPRPARVPLTPSPASRTELVSEVA